MPYGITTYGNITLVRFQDGRQHAYRGCLAGAVGSQKPKDFTLVDSERDTIDGFGFIEALVKLF